MKIAIDPFDQKALDAALKDLATYKKWVAEKEKLLRTRLGKLGESVARIEFSGATYDGSNDVTVRLDSTGSIAVIYAEGKSVAFIEFGSGAKLGGGHPMNAELGTGPGTYPDGKGHWDDPSGWYYKHGQKSWGNPPAMAMVHARDTMVEQLTAIAREVFK